MNKLGVRVFEESDLTFQLLIDGEPLGELIDAPGSCIPHRYIQDDLPSIPPYPNENHPDPEIRLVAVCECGEWGCSHAECKVIITERDVTFRMFYCRPPHTAPNVSFVFSRVNYDEVISQIAQQAAKYRSIVR